MTVDLHHAAHVEVKAQVTIVFQQNEGPIWELTEATAFRAGSRGGESV